MQLGVDALILHRKPLGLGERMIILGFIQMRPHIQTRGKTGPRGGWS